MEGMEDLADQLSERFPCELDPDNEVATALQGLIDTTEVEKVGENLSTLKEALDTVQTIGWVEFSYFSDFFFNWFVPYFLEFSFVLSFVL